MRENVLEIPYRCIIYYTCSNMRNNDDNNDYNIIIGK